MRCKFHFNPTEAAQYKNKYEFLVEFKYQMFPELIDEFNPDDYPSMLVPLQEELDENDNPEWLVEFDRPYGTYTHQLKFRKIDAGEGDEGYEPMDAPPETVEKSL